MFNTLNQQVFTDYNISEIEIWSNNFIEQINKLSKHNYTEDEILIFKRYLFYKIIFQNNLIIIKLNNDDNIKKQYINDIIKLLSLQILENTSAQLAKENLRLFFLRYFLINSSMMYDYIQIIEEQLQIARTNENIRQELENILNNISIS